MNGACKASFFGAALGAVAAAQAHEALIIIAPRALVPALGEFAAFKRERQATHLVALEDALAAGSGVDDPERLKRYLYDQWNGSHARRVLLVGDAGLVPVRYMVLDRVTAPAFDYAFYPCDLYYADVAKADGSFDDWNAAKDGFHGAYYGEVRGEKNKSDPINFDGVSYRPEMAVGRWPVNTEEEVRVVAAKTMAYETAVEMGRAGGSGGAGAGPVAGLIVTGGWVDARGAMDGMGAALGPAWRVEKRYYGEGAETTTKPPVEAEVVGLIDGGAALVLHAGHGNDDCWEGCLGVRSVAGLRNGARAAVMMSAGCSTARFATLPPYEAYEDAAGMEHKGTNAGEVFAEPPPPPSPYARGGHDRTGLGEQLLRAGPGGAVVYIGCNTGSQPCGLMLMEGFVEAMAAEAAVPGNLSTVGDCWAAAVSSYYDRANLAAIAPTEDWYPASIFFQGMKFMLFGDPSVPLPGPD